MQGVHWLWLGVGATQLSRTSVLATEQNAASLSATATQFCRSAAASITVSWDHVENQTPRDYIAYW
eukprot:SAG31_NODE_39770_length_285_cov_1.381720_1_plen_65_part_01